MTTRPQPAPGPWDAVTETPALALGAVRRTTSTDIIRPDGFTGPAIADIRGRDVHRRADGSTVILDEMSAVLELDPTGVVARVSGTISEPHRSALEGANVRRGFGRAVAERLPAEAARRSLLFSALDDLNGAFLVSGYAPLRQGQLVAAKGAGAARAEMQQDVCAGWARGGAVVELLRTADHTAVPIGPEAPRLMDSDGRWHDVGNAPVETVRRIRCLDVGRLEGDDPVAVARAHFRDSYLGADEEMVMHEYVVHAQFAQPELVLTAIEVEPRVLPWHTCPSAAPSAGALLGTPADALPARVRAELVGPSTCTHLNSTVRSLADVTALVAAIDERTGA